MPLYMLLMPANADSEAGRRPDPAPMKAMRDFQTKLTDEGKLIWADGK